MTIQIAEVNGVWCFVDSAAPTVALSDTSATDDGGKVLFDLAKTVSDNSGAAAVISVNGESGVVVLDADDLDEGVTNLYLTAAERSDIATATSSAAANALNLARIKTQQTLPAGTTTIVMDVNLGLNATLTMTNGTAYTLPLLTTTAGGGLASHVGETVVMLFLQDGTGGATLDTSAFIQRSSIAAPVSSGANKEDIVAIYIKSPTLMFLSMDPDWGLPP